MLKDKEKTLLSNFATCSNELFELGIIRSDSFTGEIGEFIASRLFKLEKPDRSCEGYDCVCSNQKRYQVKATVTSPGKYSFRTSNLKTHLFEYLIVVYFNDEYDVQKVIRVTSKDIVNGVFVWNSKTIIDVDEYTLSKFALSVEEKNAIKKFGVSIMELINNNVVRSRKIVGDIGELYAARYLSLILRENQIEKGVDAINNDGLTFEIKTRRVYHSGRRNDGDSTRRLNGLVGKSADYLIVVTLNEWFECSGMWIMPTKNIANPKSANLRTVNNTIGVKSIVPSQIHYLKTAEMFNGF